MSSTNLHKHGMTYLRELGKDIWGALRLGADAHSRLRLAVDFGLARAMRFVRVPLTDRTRVIRLRGGVRLAYRLNRADIYTIHEVWIKEMYRLPEAITPGAIIDLGANIGLAGLWLAKHYGCREVVAVEPSAPNARLAETNFRLNAIRAQIVEAAVGGEDGAALFDEGPGATTGRIVALGMHDAQDVKSYQHQVQMVSMASLLARIPPDQTPLLVKIDIEGGEQNLLSGDTAWLARVDGIVIEFHPNLIDYPRLTAIIEGAGFVEVSSWSSESVEGDHLRYYQRA